MKKIAALFFAIFAVALPLSADEFTEMIHVLAVKAASLGTYDATRVDVDYEIKNYYTPQIWAEQFAAEYGSISGERTFLGVCADFTMYAYNDIKANQQKYNKAGMRGDEFYIASVKYDTNSIEIQKATTLEGARVLENGVYMTYYYNNVPVKKYGVKNIWTHKEWDEERATNHAWIWIQRDDGVWFWVDPTWTDNLGYVVWGYIKNGEEILLKPNAKFCVKWDERYLDDRADPPARGPAIQPTYVAQAQQPSTSTQPSSSTSSQGSSSSALSYTPSYSRSSYSRFFGYDHTISVGVSKPLDDIAGGNFLSSTGGVSLSYEVGNAYSIIGLLQLDYYHHDTKSLIFSAGLGGQFGRFFALYGGAGVGLGYSPESARGLDRDGFGRDGFGRDGFGRDGFDRDGFDRDGFGLDGFGLAWKAFAGARLTFWRIALRVDVSYVSDSGVVLGAHAGWMF